MLSKEEFKSLFDDYFEDVRRYIFYRCGNDDAATDIAQETFLKIWEKRDRIQKALIKGLLFKIARDIFITQYNRTKLAFNFFETFEPNTKNLTPEDELNYRELKKAYEEALKSMPENQRVVFLMSRVDGLKYQEIADQMELSVKAIEKRMSHAIEHLRKNLKYGLIILILILSTLTFSSLI